MDEEVLENLIVRLTGDPTAYFKALDEAISRTKDFSQEVIGTLAGIGSAMGVAGAFDMYANLEQTTVRLGAAIRASGRDVEAVTADYKAFAEQISGLTLTSRPAALALLQQAEAFGVTGDKAKEAVKAAISVAALRRGMAPEAAIGPVAAAIATGDMRRLSWLLPTLRGIKDESEKAAKAQKLLGIGWATAQELVGTASGAMIRLGYALKGFTAAAGETIAGTIKPLVLWLTQLVSLLKDNAAFKNATVAALSFFGVMMMLRPAIFGVTRAIGAMQAGLKTLLGLVSWPRLLAVGALTAAAFLIKQHFGSWEKAWDAVKEKALVVWGYIKAYWKVFIDWVTPYWQQFSLWFQGKWEDFRQWAEAAWDKIKTKVEDFVFWAKPIFRGVVDFFLSYWGFLAKGAVAVWDFIRTVVGKAASWIGEKLGLAFDKIDWLKVRLYLLELLATAIFAFDNFGRIVKINVALWKAEWETAKNSFLFTFTDEIPAALSWFRDHWKDMCVFMLTAWNLANDAMVSSLVQTFKNLPALIQGKMQLQDVLAPVFNQFNAAMKGQLDQLASTLPKVPLRAMTETEKALWTSFLKQNRAFVGDWADFVKGKIRDWMKEGPPIAPEKMAEAERKAKDAGDRIGGGFAEHVKHQTDKLEAHLKGSAEALAAVQEYWDHLNDRREGEGGLGGGKGGAEGTAPAPTPQAQPTAADKITLGMDAVVEAIKDSTRRIVAKLEEPLPRTVKNMGQPAGPNIKPMPPL